MSMVLGDDFKRGEYNSCNYAYQDFLGTHHDEAKGKLAYTFYASKDWKPSYGGVLYLMSKDGKVLEEAVTPDYNRLVVLALPNGRGRDHCVTPIASTTFKRISFQGWLK
jgi:Rps23 Pro-64 3,4-dihydroxylase Tpa1-like proline 4-hydroxylase